MTVLRPPARLALLGETRFALEYLALRAALPRLKATAAHGSGRTVLVVPGFATDDSWTSSLRGFLAAIGHDVRGWGLGRNHGNVHRLIPALGEQVEVSATGAGDRIALIGWSLGGYLAREVARERPDLVSRVITLGAPVVGGPKYTASAPYYRRRGYDLEAIEAEVVTRDAVPIMVPVDAIFSRSDGVVAWRACLDTVTPAVRHHEVRTSHLGLIASRQAYRLLADLLARPTTVDRPPRSDP